MLVFAAKLSAKLFVVGTVTLSWAAVLQTVGTR